MKRIMLAVSIMALAIWSTTIFAKSGEDDLVSCPDKNFNIASGDVAALISAIEAANSDPKGATINLEAGTYTLTAASDEIDGGNGLPTIVSQLCINGAGADSTVIEREKSSGRSFRILHIDDTGFVVIDGLAVQNGGNFDDDGAGIRNSGILTVINSTIFNNSNPLGAGRGRGGGIFNDAGTVTLMNSTVGRNFSGFDGGGGIFNTNGGTLVIVNSVIDKNGTLQGGQGGGILNDSGIVKVSRSTIANNFTGSGSFGEGEGGGISNGDTLIIKSSTIANNSAVEGSGGGISNFGLATITNSTIANNIAAFGTFDGGGGIINIASGTMTITNSTIANNTAGGQIDERGGGILNLSGTIELRNTILAMNSVPNDVGPDCFGEFTSLGNNLIGDTSDCIITPLPSDLTGDPGLDAFTNLDRPGSGHFPLLSDSQAIDAGNNEACPPTDQVGHPRVDGDGDGTVICDIGAIELLSEEPRVQCIAELRGPAITRNGEDVDSGTIPLGDGFFQQNAEEGPLAAFEVVNVALPCGTRLDVCLENDDTKQRKHLLQQIFLCNRDTLAVGDALINERGGDPVLSPEPDFVVTPLSKVTRGAVDICTAVIGRTLRVRHSETASSPCNEHAILEGLIIPSPSFRNDDNGE